MSKIIEKFKPDAPGTTCIRGGRNITIVMIFFLIFQQISYLYQVKTKTHSPSVEKHAQKKRDSPFGRYPLREDTHLARDIQPIFRASLWAGTRASLVALFICVNETD